MLTEYKTDTKKSTIKKKKKVLIARRMRGERGNKKYNKTSTQVEISLELKWLNRTADV